MEPKKRDPLTLDNGKGFFREMQIEFLIHELKDPIAIIETGARILLEKREKYGSLTPLQEKSLKRVLRNTQKAREMLQDLLEIGRSEAGNFMCCSFQPAGRIYDVLLAALEIKSDSIYEEVKDLNRTDEALALLRKKGIYFELDPQLSTKDIRQDQTKFCQIIGNLIKNALHYKRERIHVKATYHAKHLIVEVSDDGPGISPEHHEMIFQRYTQVNACETLSRQSHGLGLAGALVLARCLGGDIEIDSEAGQGTTFRLTLPVALESEYRV